MVSRTSSADPEKLRRYAEAMAEQNHWLQSTSRQLRACLERFERQCREPGMRVTATHVADGIRAFANQCEPADLWVRQVGNAFVRADRLGVGSVVPPVSYSSFIEDHESAGLGLSVSVAAPLIAVPEWLKERLGFLPDIIPDTMEQAGDVQQVARAAPYISGLSGNAVWDAAQLGGKYFTRGFRDLVNTPISKLSPWMILGVGLELVSEGKENWEEYRGDIGRTAIGLAFDTGLGLTGSLVGGAAGTLVGGALGSLAGPAGTVIGAKLGGVVGGYLGSRAADWVEDIKVGDEDLDQHVVRNVADIGKNVGESVHYTVADGIDRLVNIFDGQPIGAI